eukprot:CAMPEP_0171139400 /NCGR_PEP_ID=MMETSP0766_2-20121228/136819_1 /TAXON_ID=439317 /ORGANISM="Gambierdiscus australes, Strain CAWD 149" /LENGTH=84 /DNA_ID=CAMNT_0011603063 /DNA_START=260 /DNA_END=511 /DNA_ORIENTATION=-
MVAFVDFFVEAEVRASTSTSGQPSSNATTEKRSFADLPVHKAVCTRNGPLRREGALAEALLAVPMSSSDSSTSGALSMGSELNT